MEAYAANQLLEIIDVFEAPISVGNASELISTFYVIKNGKQSLSSRDTAIQLEVLKLGLSVAETNTDVKAKPFPEIKNISIKLCIDSSVKSTSLYGEYL